MAGSRHLVDPELLKWLDLVTHVEWNSATLSSLRETHSAGWNTGETFNPELVEKREVLAPGRDGAPDVPLIIYRPANKKNEALPCIYHIHGGGYICQRASSTEIRDRRYVESLACALVSVDYRLAPETPYPGPIEDCYAGLAWLFAHAQEEGVDPSKIGVLGESAGGGLAASLALLVRDRKEYQLAFQQLICPMLDDRTCVTKDPNPYAGEFVWTRNDNAFGWRCYLGKAPGSEDISPYAAAARAKDLSGLPPTYIATSSLDLFVDEDIAYATRLIRAGVPTELHVYAGGFHGFNFGPPTQVADRTNRDIVEGLRRILWGV